MRRKPKLFEEENDVAAEDHEPNGFKTTPKPIQHLQVFEEDFIKMVQNVMFKTTRSRFHNELLKIVRDLGNCKSLIVPSHKTLTTNFYETSVADYKRLSNDNVTADHCRRY